LSFVGREYKAAVLRDQRGELERLPKVDVADLTHGRLRDEQVSRFERSAEDGARVPL